MDSEKRAATEAAHMAATAPDQPDGWAPPMAADALLMRGRLALLDGKFRVGRVEVVSFHPLHAAVPIDFYAGVYR